MYCSLIQHAVCVIQVVSKYQVQLSAFKALEAEAANKLTTKTLHAELVYGLAGSTHVRRAGQHSGAIPKTPMLMIGWQAFCSRLAYQRLPVATAAVTYVSQYGMRCYRFFTAWQYVFE